MQASPDFYIGVISGLLGAAIYGVSVVVYKSQSDEIRPLSISALKMWVALPLLAFLILFGFGTNPFALDLSIVFLLAISIILGAVLGDTIYLMSQERIGVSYAFPISMSFPIITYFLTVYFLGESPSAIRFIGVIVAVTGVILISRGQENNSESSVGVKVDILGFFLAIMTAIFYAAGTTILQVGVQDIDPISGNFVRILAGSVAFVPIIGTAQMRGMRVPNPRTASIILVTGFFGMGLGSILYVAGVKYAGAAVMSVLASTAPLFAVPISIIFLKERVTATSGMGITLTLIGIFLVVLGF